SPTFRQSIAFWYPSKPRNRRSSGTSNFSFDSRPNDLTQRASLSSNTSATATSLIGPLLVASALAAAPVPRPPQPISATWIVLSSAACTAGIATPARAEVAATCPVVLRKSRREVDVGELDSARALVVGLGSVISAAPRSGNMGIRRGKARRPGR